MFLKYEVQIEAHTHTHTHTNPHGTQNLIKSNNTNQNMPVTKRGLVLEVQMI